jgi:nucleotide-binding universal stress UspA family protein
MYGKIVVPLDGSGLAERVLEYVRGLAVASGAQVELLNVCPQSESEGRHMHRVYLQRVQQVLRSQLKQAGSTQATVDSVALLGDPAEEILRYGERNKADLIAMTTHGRSGVRRWAIGSVADKVARHSAVPVWLVRCDAPETIGEKWPERRILVLLDGSKRAERVLPYVVDHAKVSGAEVVLFRVCQRPSLSPFAYSATALPWIWQGFIERVNADQLEECYHYLAGPERRLKDAGVRVRSEALLGSSRDEILRYIGRHSLSLIALTSHGRCGIARLALGSLAERIVLGCSIPLLLAARRRRREFATGLGIRHVEPRIADGHCAANERRLSAQCMQLV